MKRFFLTLIFGLVIGSPLAVLAQVVEPPEQSPAKKPVKFKATAPLSVKAGDHIVIDASSAAGEVWFFFDEATFPKSRATIAGKLLVLSTNVNGKHAIDVASLDDKAKERIVVTVTGGIDPPVDKLPPDKEPPPDPKPDDLKSILALITKLDARVSALEAAKPPPAGGALAHVSFVFSSTDSKAIAINNSPALRTLLATAGIKAYTIYSSGLSSQGEKFQKAVADGGGIPIAVLQDKAGNVIDCIAMQTVDQVTKAFAKHLRSEP